MYLCPCCHEPAAVGGCRCDKRAVPVAANSRPTPVEGVGLRNRKHWFISYVLRSDPLDPPELPEPDLPELDDCPEAGLCGEIWPLPVPVLPALVYWLLPVPGPPCWFFVLSSGRSLFWPGVVEPLCWVDDWLPLPDWVPRFICCDPLPDWLSRLLEVLPRFSESFAIRLLLEMPPLSPRGRIPVPGGSMRFERTRIGGSCVGCTAIRPRCLVFNTRL